MRNGWLFDWLFASLSASLIKFCDVKVVVASEVLAMSGWHTRIQSYLDTMTLL
jgi:hypothetical protein